MAVDFAGALEALWRARPLVHQITNYVSMNDCANITLAAGASPVMAQDRREAADMAAQARALVVNLGTLQSHHVEAMFEAARRARALSIPVVFDPVGAGGVPYRTEVAAAFLQEIRPAIVRCNLSEARTLCGLQASGRGVDAGEDGAAPEAARLLAQRTGGVAAVTGATDYVAQGGRVARVENGHAHLARVTGTGCMTTALCASFAAVCEPFRAAVCGVAAMGVAGEIAAASLRAGEGLGTFRVRLVDAVSLLDGAQLARLAKLYEEGGEGLCSSEN